MLVYLVNLHMSIDIFQQDTVAAEFDSALQDCLLITMKCHQNKAENQIKTQLALGKFSYQQRFCISKVLLAICAEAKGREVRP